MLPNWKALSQFNRAERREAGSKKHRCRVTKVRLGGRDWPPDSFGKLLWVRKYFSESSQAYLSWRAFFKRTYNPHTWQFKRRLAQFAQAFCLGEDTLEYGCGSRCEQIGSYFKDFLILVAWFLSLIAFKPKPIIETKQIDEQLVIPILEFLIVRRVGSATAYA